MKICVKCKNQFEFTEQDKQFLQKVSPRFGEIPEPDLCQICRQQRRLSFRNERNLYVSECESCKKRMVSVYSPDKNYHVWCQSCWWSDKWDPVDLGRDFDFGRPFFEQFNELIHDSKLINLFGKNNENSEFVNQEADDKNCYMNAGGHFNEDCYYNTYSIWGKNNVDNYWVIKSELLYECIKSERCFSSTYLEYCENCTDCHYCMDCKGCTSCFGSYGLRHKQYYFFNQPFSKEEYEQKVAIYLNSYAGRKRSLFESQQRFLKFPHKSSHLINCINSTGDDLLNCKNVIEGYLFENSEDLKYAYIGLDVKDGMDLSSIGWGEILYNCASSMELNNVMCVTTTANLNFSQYCFVCFNSSNVFGCVGLNRKEYCILNKQYTKEEYESLMLKIAEHMRQTEEWTQFFPSAISPFGYNETVAQEYFPLTKQLAIQNNFKWKDDDQREYQLQTYTGDYDISQFQDAISKEIFVCRDCRRNYRIIQQEFDFYQRMKLPLPDKCDQCRHKRRLMRKNSHQLWERNCCTCSEVITTSYSPERAEIVYCEKCYLETVY